MYSDLQWGFGPNYVLAKLGYTARMRYRKGLSNFCVYSAYVHVYRSVRQKLLRIVLLLINLSNTFKRAMLVYTYPYQSLDYDPIDFYEIICRGLRR